MMKRGTTYSFTMGPYAFAGIGTGLAMAHLGHSLVIAIFGGVFWPVSVAYYLLRALADIGA